MLDSQPQAPEGETNGGQYQLVVLQEQWLDAKLMEVNQVLAKYFLVIMKSIIEKF